MFDVLIHGAKVYDGCGSEAEVRSIAAKAGRIVAARKGDKAARVVEADGLALMPGIIDLHTHYDAQVTWDPRMSPSPALGVTTAVMGNCGFGIAPCPREMRETVLRNLSVVEGMDVEALLAGTRWEFESFDDYLGMLERLKPWANVAVLAQHSTIRSAVMGEEAAERREPTPDQLARMRAIIKESLQSGAAGFASSWSPNHSGWGGRPMPSTIAGEEEIKALASVLGEEKRGVFAMATGARATPEFMESVAAATGRPAFIVTVAAMYNQAKPKQALDWYERCARALERGNEVYVQANCQPLSFDFTLREPYILYSHGAFERVKAAKPEERAKIYQDPNFRAQLLSDFKNPKQGILFYGDWSQVERDGVPVSELARKAGKDPLDYVFDLDLDVQLVGKLYQNDDAEVAKLLKHKAGVVALSDAGAHLIYFCDAGFGLHFLAHWVRELGVFTLEEGVRRLTSDPARKYRIPQRGAIVPGNWADLVLFDPKTVGVSPLRRTKDMPAGGSRMLRDPVGVHGVWVNGVQVHDGKRYTDLAVGPGAVLRDFAS